MKKQKASSQSQSLNPENFIRYKSRSIPLYKCYISSDWKELNLANIFITRKHVTGNVTACIYLVDLACLGVKDTFFKFNTPFEEVEKKVGASHRMRTNMIETSYELVHNIIYAGVNYAEKYGFKPHKDFTEITSHFLEEDNGTIPSIEIKCGRIDGKPTYVNTGHETSAQARQIVSQLEKTAGKDNYHFILRAEDGIGFCDNNNNVNFYSEENDDEFYIDDDDDDDNDDDNDDDLDDDDDDYDDDYDLDDDDEYEYDNKYEIIDEIKQLSREERENLYMDFTKEEAKNLLDPTKFVQLGALCHFLVYDITDSEAIEEQLELLEQTFDNQFVDESQLPNSLFAGIQNIDGETIANLFYDIIESDEKPEKAIAELQEIIGDVPLIDYLDIHFAEDVTSKKHQKKLKEYYQKHPDYFLIQAHYATCFVEKNITEALQNLLRAKEYPFTMFEADIYFYLYALLLSLDNTTELAKVLAFDKYLEGIDFIAHNTASNISTMMKIFKMGKLTDYFEKKEKNYSLKK